jgi:hypothetical protein
MDMKHIYHQKPLQPSDLSMVVNMNTASLHVFGEGEWSNIKLNAGMTGHVKQQRQARERSVER